MLEFIRDLPRASLFCLMPVGRLYIQVQWSLVMLIFSALAAKNNEVVVYSVCKYKYPKFHFILNIEPNKNQVHLQSILTGKSCLNRVHPGCHPRDKWGRDRRLNSKRGLLLSSN